VASIYGMNVPIPYANSPFAFYIPVFLSLVISLVIGWFFLKKKIF
jgi:magnesium transporter